MIGGGWRCQLIDDFSLGGQRIAIYRHDGDTLVYLTDWDERGTPMIKALPMNESADTSKLPWLPYDALTALAEAVRPGPTQAEVKRLEDALLFERARVDRLLNALIPVVPTAVERHPTS